jgi:hypothetical protein
MTQTETESTTQTIDVSTIDNSEPQLTNEVAELWMIHNEAKTSLHRGRDELKRIRTDLSQRLHALKAVLSRPGRGGAWSSFLVSQTIPRSTADRLVRAHKKTMSADPDSCTTGQTKESSEVVIRRYVHALWPRLSRVLTTPEALDVFVAELRRTADKSFANKRSVSSPAKSSGIPSYLLQLNLPVKAVSGDAAHG